VPAATIAGAIAQVLLLVLVGVALRRFGALKRDDAGPLNAVIVYAALPALIFVSVAQADLSWELVKVAAVAWAVSLAGLSVAWEIAHALKMEKRTAGAFVLVAALGNTGYVGYPVVRALLGPQALPQAVFYDVFGTVAAAFTLGVAVAARQGEHTGRINPLRELLTFPAMIALIVALLYRFVPLSGPVSKAVMDWMTIPANMTVPLMMVSLGVTLDISAFKGSLGPLGAAAAIKLALLPFLAVAVTTIMKDSGIARVVMVEAGMPSMLLSLVIGQRFKLDTGFIAAAVLLTTVLCIVTIPIAQFLLP
jgi:predicted permease